MFEALKHWKRSGTAMGEATRSIMDSGNASVPGIEMIRVVRMREKVIKTELKSG